MISYKELKRYAYLGCILAFFYLIYVSGPPYRPHQLSNTHFALQKSGTRPQDPDFYLAHNLNQHRHSQDALDITSRLVPVAPHVVDPRCPYGINIFVYDLDNNSTGQEFLKYALTFRGPFCQDDCSDAQFSTEIHFWRYLLQSPCRTRDPEQAHLFYIPYQETLQVLSEQRPKDAFDIMYDALALGKYDRLEEVHGMPNTYLARHGGLDHVMTLATPPFFEHVLTATLPRLDFALLTTIIPEIWRHQLQHKQTIGSENVVVVPYPVVNPPWTPVRDTKPISQRRYLASGLYGLHGDGETVRRLLIDSANMLAQSKKFVGRLLFGEFAEKELKSPKFKGKNLAQMMFETVFCMSPAGDSLSTRRLFNAMFAGCIPVMFGEDLVLPFHRLHIPYEDFIIRLPMSYAERGIDGGVELYHLLFDLVMSGKAETLQKNLRKNLQRLAFNLPFPEVPTFPLSEETRELDTGEDAFDALMWELRLRTQEIEVQKKHRVH